MTEYVKAKDGTEYPVRFSQGTLMQLARYEGIPLKNFGKEFARMMDWPIDRVYRLYYLAFRSGARADGAQFTMTEDEFMDWVIEDDETIMPQVAEIFRDSFSEGKEGGGGKKKTTST